LFFPLAPSADQERRAKAVCAGCPVVMECRVYALRVGEREGIWGGLTPKERRRRFSAVEAARKQAEAVAAGRTADG
jgi:WhiB family redox-sensing transcriptional regulator